MDIILFFTTLLCSFLSLIAVFCLTPKFTPDNICFGVRIPEEAARSSKIKKLRQNFVVSCAVSGILFGTTAAFIRKYNALFVCLLFFCIFSLFNYLVSARTVKSMQQTEDIPPDSNIYISNMPENRKIKAFSLWWELILLIFPAGEFALSYYFKTEYVIPLFSAAIFTAVFFIHLCIQIFPLYADKKNFEATVEKAKKIRRKWAFICFLSGFVLQLSMLVMHLPLLGVLLNGVFLSAVPFISVVIIVVFSIIFGLKK